MLPYYEYCYESEVSWLSNPDFWLGMRADSRHAYGISRLIRASNAIPGIVEVKKIKYLSVLILFVLGACSTVVTNKNEKSVSRHPMIPADWPTTENADEVILTVVNPYEKRCCGATPRYEVSLTNLFGEKIFKHDDLLPIDDFFCVALKPGRYSIALRSGTASHSMEFEAKAGQHYFVAADVRLVEPREMLLYPMQKTSAMPYVHRAANRIAPIDENAGQSARLQMRLGCERSN